MTSAPALPPTPSRPEPPRRASPGLAALVTASALLPSLSERVWAIAPAERPTCQAFLLTDGAAHFERHDGPSLGLVAPALLWLPRSAVGRFRLQAGSQGFAGSLAEDFVRRSVGDGIALGAFRALLDEVTVATADRLAPALDVVVVLFAALVREAREAQPDSGAMMSLHLGLLLLHLRRASAAGATASLRAAGTTTVQRFRQLIELHYRQSPGIAGFARLLNVTRSHLHDACLRTTGRTPLALVHERLIEEAQLRLEQTDLAIEQVGYSLGFRDAGYFNRFFKRLTGLSPGQHRRAAARLRAVPKDASFAAWP